MQAGELGLSKPKTLEVFDFLASNFPQVQIIAVAGKNKKMEDFFKSTAKKYNRENDICVLDYTNKVPELMSVSDFVISKPGGLTATESIISGLPILIINPIVGHEEQNAEFLENAGVGILLKDSDDVNAVFNKLLSAPETLEQMRINASKLAKPNSSREIVEILFH